MKFEPVTWQQAFRRLGGRVQKCEDGVQGVSERIDVLERRLGWLIVAAAAGQSLWDWVLM